MNFCDLDFEYRKTTSPTLDLVSCALTTGKGVEKLWLFKEDYTPLLNRLKELSKDHIFVSYAAEAEALSMLSLGFPFEDLVKCKFTDLFLEYRMLMNHNDIIMFGKHLVEGKEKILKKFIDAPPPQSLASATYKMLGVIIDTKEKDWVRDIIINGTDEDVLRNKDRILDYNASDIKYLTPLRLVLRRELERLINSKRHKMNLDSEIFLRGEYAVRTAQMVKIGTPLNLEWVKNLTDNVPVLMEETIQDINEQFPELEPFKFKKSTATWSMNQVGARKWLVDNKHDKGWARTDTNLLSLSLDSWTDRFSFTHSYPRDNFGAQMVRFLKLKQSLNGFIRKSGSDSKSFWDYVGEDGRVRSYFNIYKAQSSRSQPASTGFIFLKPAWQRSVVQPPKGRMVVGIDYGSEEFLLAGLMSGDEEMLEAYKSGDVYLHFGKSIDMIPANGTKDTHKFERNLCKSTVLGLSYMMSKIGLSRKLTMDTGKEFNEDQAQEMVDKFYYAYPTFSQYRRKIIEDYVTDQFIRLPCGWYMWKDNDNTRSVANMPIQGMGASIMRKAVALAQDAGIDIIFTLHDAIYAEVDLKDWEAVSKLAECMKFAFTYYFPKVKEANYIRMEGECWSEELEEGQVTVFGNTPIKIEKVHIDERSLQEYKTYSKYFTTNKNINLL
jgi:hypothetical protein